MLLGLYGASFYSKPPAFLPSCLLFYIKRYFILYVTELSLLLYGFTSVRTHRFYSFCQLLQSHYLPRWIAISLHRTFLITPRTHTTVRNFRKSSKNPRSKTTRRSYEEKTRSFPQSTSNSCFYSLDKKSTRSA